MPAGRDRCLTQLSPWRVLCQAHRERVHWHLDVSFREDDSRVRERVLGSNITWLYRFTLSILKQHPDRRQSLIMKRRACGWSDEFLMEVIGALTS